MPFKSIQSLALVGALSAAALFATAPGAGAAPYSLPIATSGPVGAVDSPAASTVALRQLAAQVGLAQFTAPDWHVGTVRHVVMFRYKSTTTMAQRAEITARFLHLAQDTRRPDGAHPIVSIETGMQNGGEGNDDGLQQAFVVTLRSEGDRNFYVGKPVVTDPAFFDPAHEAFKEFAFPYLEKVVAFDFDVIATETPSVSRHIKRR